MHMSTEQKTVDKKPHMKKTDSKHKEIEQLKTEIQLLQQELKEKNDKLLRSYADFQNLQKRIEKEINDKEIAIKSKYLSELIDIDELLQKALLDKNPKDGLQLIRKQLHTFFENENIRYIECIGKAFDHAQHHAVSTLERDDCTDNEVIDEIKRGYLINDRVIRPSQVIVARKKEEKVGE